MLRAIAVPLALAKADTAVHLLKEGFGRAQWQPTKEGYLKFLVESKEVFKTMEDIVQEASHPECAPSAHTLQFWP